MTATLLLVCLICLASVYRSRCLELTVKSAESSAWQLSSAIKDMVESTFVTKLQLLAFNCYVHAIQRAHMRFFEDIITYTLRALNESRITVRVGANNYLPGDHQRHNGVLLVDSAASLRFLYKQLESAHLHVSGYYIIVLHTFRGAYYDELFALSELNWQSGVINANVLVHALPQQILLFSSFPYSSHHCAGTAPVLANSYNVVEARWQHQNFFPDKLSNFYGCPVLCATWEEMPYLHVEPGAREMQGIEGKLLEFLALKLNFTIVFRWMNATEIEGTLAYDSATFHSLFRDGVEFAIGAYHYRPSQWNDSYAPTHFYYLSAYNFIVNAHPTAYGPFMKLLFPFARHIWLLLLLLFATGALVAVLLTGPARRLALGAPNRMPSYNMFVVCVGGGVHSAPFTHAARQLLWLWLTLTLVLRSTYTALMYHFIRTDIIGDPPPDTLGELAKQNYSYLMSASAYNAMRNVQPYQGNLQQLNSSEIVGFELLRERAEQSLALVTAYEYFGHWRRTHMQQAADLHVVPERVFTQHLSIYMRRSSILLRRFNENINLYLSVGLMQKWSNHLIYSDVGRVRRVAEDEPQVMQLGQLTGPFHLLWLGLALSGLVLIGELLCYVATVCLRRLCACWSRCFRRH